LSKYQFQQSDIYQPGTDLPINRLNIGDAEILHEIEAQLLQQAYETFVSELTSDTRFDEAYYQSELIALHPFYELNGRITRLFFDLITIHNGYGPIDYGLALRDDPEVDNNYIRASVDCVQRADPARLRELVFAGLVTSASE
jgi:fido (protein-threonine AMPylation protein)